MQSQTFWRSKRLPSQIQIPEPMGGELRDYFLTILTRKWIYVDYHEKMCEV